MKEKLMNMFNGVKDFAQNPETIECAKSLAEMAAVAALAVGLQVLVKVTYEHFAGNSIPEVTPVVETN